MTRRLRDIATLVKVATEMKVETQANFPRPALDGYVSIHWDVWQRFVQSLDALEDTDDQTA